MADDLFGATPAAAPVAVTLRDMVACLGREVRMREAAYPKWVRSHRMTADEADRELARMRAALNLVAAIAAPTDDLLEAVAKELDREDSALRGEPSPWREDLLGEDETFRSERRAVVRTGLETLVEAVR